MNTHDHHEELRQRVADVRDSTEYRTEQTIDSITEAIVDRLAQLGLTRADLAARLGVSPARITNLLRGRNNYTVRTLTEVAVALECNLTLALVPSTVRAQAATDQQSRRKPGPPEVAAEARATYRARTPTATYESRDGEIREHLASGKLRVEDGIVLMRRERDGAYRPATLRRTGGRAGKLRTNVGPRAYYLDRILAVAADAIP